MKKLQPLATACLGASIVLLAAPLRNASSPVGELPPGVAAGSKIYWVQTRTETLRSLAGPTPVEILETNGAWALIKSTGIGFDPIWINFDQVVHYKTSR